MKRQRFGFTLVELLVVIAIIGVLAGLLLPAVQSAREAARLAECSTKMKMLGYATIQYDITKKSFPGWIDNYGAFPGGMPDPSVPSTVDAPAHLKIGTWAVRILPYVDAQPTYEIWTENKYPVIGPSVPEFPSSDDAQSGYGYTANAAPNLPAFQCPSSPVTAGNVGRNNYVSNNGFHPFEYDGTTLVTIIRGSSSTTASYESSQKKANGAFVNKFARGSAYPEGPRVSFDDIKDGATNTVLYSENLQALPWHRAGLAMSAPATNSFDPTSLDLAALDVSRYTNGMVYFYEDSQPINGALSPVLPLHKINGGTQSEDKFILEMPTAPASGVRALTAGLARPSSAHVDGVNMSFADGSVRFVTQTVDHRVYQAYMTLRGKSSDVPYNEYVLQGVRQ